MRYDEPRLVWTSLDCVFRISKECYFLESMNRELVCVLQECNASRDMICLVNKKCMTSWARVLFTFCFHSLSHDVVGTPPKKLLCAIIHGEMMVSVRGAGKPGTSEGGRLPRAAEHGCSAALCILVWCVLSLLGVDAVHGCAGKCLRSNRTTFYIVGMVPFGGFVSSYGPAFKHYLDNEVGTKYEPRITFDIRQDNLQVPQTCAAGPACAPTCTRRDAHVHRRTLQRAYIRLRLRTQDGEKARGTERHTQTSHHTRTHMHAHACTHARARARAHTHTHTSVGAKERAFV